MHNFHIWIHNIVSCSFYTKPTVHLFLFSIGRRSLSVSFWYFRSIIFDSVNSRAVFLWSVRQIGLDVLLHFVNWIVNIWIGFQILWPIYMWLAEPIKFGMSRTVINRMSALCKHTFLFEQFRFYLSIRCTSFFGNRRSTVYHIRKEGRSKTAPKI